MICFAFMYQIEKPLILSISDQKALYYYSPKSPQNTAM